jgi:homoserine O-acetyltransferase/O-succinyltransferase
VDDTPRSPDATAGVARAPLDQRRREIDRPTSRVHRFDSPLPLDCGRSLPSFQIAYCTHGTLNAAKSNAILICHALTGDQYVVDDNPVTGKPGWWTSLIGPGLPIDTNRFFVICSNVIGGCMGSTGPASIDPGTGQPYGVTFPVVTIADMVRAQTRLIEALGIDTLFSVIGGSMGGMQVLQWAATHGDRVRTAMPIATAAWHSAQNIAFHEVGRQAIMADPEWCSGAYLAQSRFPTNGLAVARMAAHITYLSEDALQRKFGRGLQDRTDKTFTFDADFQIESYLRHQGRTFVDRFDANSYLYITRAAGECLRGHQDALLRRLLHERLALPDARQQSDRAGVERGGRQRVVRRSGQRQGPRCVLAR